MEKRLLIVDDEPRLTGSFKIIFENKGFSVLTSSNGHDALENFKKAPFKVVLSDIQMDEMDGIQLMHELKRIDPLVQIIFLTGYTSVETAAIALKQNNNAFEYLEKPVRDMNELCRIVERAEGKYDREKDQIALQKKNEQGFSVFKSIFDSMEAIVYVADMQTYELIYANKKCMEIFGPDEPTSLEGKKCWQILQKGQTGPCEFCTNHRLLTPGGRPGDPFEWDFLNTCNQRWYSIVDKAVEWSDKRIVRMETAFDITEKKEHEHLFRKFEQAVQNSKKLESIGTLAGGVAHDFNNTLATIIGNINLAQLCCPDDDTKKYLRNAEEGVMQAKRISSKLITFAKGGGPVKTKTDIEGLIRKAVVNTIDPEKIICSFETDKIPVPFYADQDQLKAAVNNILQNSVESMEGPGRIDIAVRYLEQAMKNPRISISISDSGCGIPREHLDMVFNPYFTTKPLDNKKSTGLGLSVAWSIISKHGGNIHVESNLGQGTRVHIFLPIFSENRQTNTTGENSTQKPSLDMDKGLTRVLVMDDDELTLDVVSQLLIRLGYEALVVKNAEHAVEVCQAAGAGGPKIDLALLDYDIKTGAGGFPTMARIKEIDPGIRGILMTGHSDYAEIQKYREFGFSDMLEKPFSIKLLDRKIKACLS